MRKLGSSASLGKYDVKIIKRRVPLNSLDEESDFAQQVESIRYELSKNNAAGNEGGEDRELEETILSGKRYAKIIVLWLVFLDYICGHVKILVFDQLNVHVPIGDPVGFRFLADLMSVVYLH